MLVGLSCMIGRRLRVWQRCASCVVPCHVMLCYVGDRASGLSYAMLLGLSAEHVSSAGRTRYTAQMVSILTGSLEWCAYSLFIIYQKKQSQLLPNPVGVQTLCILSLLVHDSTACCRHFCRSKCLLLEALTRVAMVKSTHYGSRGWCISGLRC